MKSLLYFSILISTLISCAQNNKNPDVTNASIMTHVYLFKNHFLNLDTLKLQDTSAMKGYIEIQRESYHASFFGQGKNERIAEYKNLNFELRENRDITISDSKGRLIKTVSDPDKKKTTDNICGNSVLFAVPTGVVCAIRLAEESGYHICKYDENGTLINQWNITHTLYKKEGNMVESIPYLFYFAHTDKEMIFSSIYYSKPHETIILNLVDGTKKKIECSIGGIIIDEKTKALAGLIHFNDSEKKMETEFGKFKWAVDDPTGSNCAKCVFKDSVLYIATYHNIATGCSVNAYNINSGKLIWKGDVKQLMVGHSEYFNIVHLTLFENKLILEGNEAYGDYLQVLDIKTGKRLFEAMPDIGH
ncbi:MAG: hypothetical protein HY958_10840 [Bacteroidia bacterium]|nr:hypothetical protein [Bacteroidia bacterium]